MPSKKAKEKIQKNTHARQKLLNELLTAPPPDQTVFVPLTDVDQIRRTPATQNPDGRSPNVDPEIVTIDPDKTFHDQYVAASKLARIHNLTNELAKRRIESISIYEPLPVQAEFHKCRSAYRLLRGSNRAGKTLSAAMEVAMAVTGRDPYEKFPKRDGVFVIVGKDERHLGIVQYDKLFRPQHGFRIIRDKVTHRWRAWKPWLPEDAEREDETKPAPPLIPPRYVAEVGWTNKKENVPSVIRLTTGWEMLFFTSGGKPPQGFPCDGFWFDEEIIDPSWYPEMAARSVDRGGRGIWSATPQAGTDQLYELHERAEKERATLPEKDRRISEFVVLMADNQYMSAEAKVNFSKDLSDEERRVRVGGEFALTSYKVYPTFNMIVHGHPFFEIPSTWSIYAYVDPGFRTCAVLFAAVPPPEHSDQMLIIFKELYIHECTAHIFAQAMKSVCEHRQIQAFVIDAHMALQTEMGVGKTVLQQYTAALVEAKVKSVSTGSGFLFANDDIDAGVLAVQNLLRVREDGKPRLRVMLESGSLTRSILPNFDHEIRRYHRKRVAGVVQDRPDNRKDNHLMDCFDPLTEVLTDAGWKPFPLISKEDKLATVDLYSDAIIYQNPTEIISRNHDGDMYKFGGHKLDAMVTGNHRMVVYPKIGYKGYNGGKPVVKMAKDVTKWDSVKLHAKWSGIAYETISLPASGMSKAVEVDAHDYAELCGWYIAEGCCAKKVRMPGHGYSVVISQKKESGRNAIRDLLKRLPWAWNENSGGFYFSCKQLWEQFYDLGDCYSKRVPEWIKAAAPSVIERFINGSVAGDGWVQAGRRNYSTVSKRLADDMQELFIKIGRSASIREVQPKPYNIHGSVGDNTVVQYWVSEWIKPTGLLRDSQGIPNFHAFQYKGMVYCATVPNGTLIVRRNGKPMVVGNCLRYLALHDPKYVKPPANRTSPGGAIKMFRDKQKRASTKDGGEGAIHMGPGGKFF